MKATLTSINKPHIDKILDGIKTIEWRTKPLPIGRHYAYETKRHGGRGIITGSFDVIKHYTFFKLDEIPESYIEKGAVSREYLAKYAKGRPIYANIIINPVKFKIPLELYNFIGYSSGQLVTVPPQSFMYIDIHHYKDFAQVE